MLETEILSGFLFYWKESGASSNPLPSTPTTDRLGSGTSEPLLTTGDALEKYQIISEKVLNALLDCCFFLLLFLPLLLVEKICACT